MRFLRGMIGKKQEELEPDDMIEPMEHLADAPESEEAQTGPDADDLYASLSSIQSRLREDSETEPASRKPRADVAEPGLELGEAVEKFVDLVGDIQTEGPDVEAGDFLNEDDLDEFDDEFDDEDFYEDDLQDGETVVANKEFISGLDDPAAETSIDIGEKAAVAAAAVARSVSGLDSRRVHKKQQPSLFAKPATSAPQPAGPAMNRSQLDPRTGADKSEAARQQAPGTPRAPEPAPRQEKVLPREAEELPAPPEPPAPVAQEPAPAPAANVVEVPAPAAGRAGRRAGRVKTRLLGFEHAGALGADPFDGNTAAPARQDLRFPVGWIVVADGPGRGASFALINGVSSVGRGEDQAVRLDFGDNAISRQNHAAIAYDQEQRRFFLGHGGKANLVRLNDRPVLSTELLSSGDTIRIGETLLRFVALCGEEFDWDQGKRDDVDDAAIA